MPNSVRSAAFVTLLCTSAVVMAQEQGSRIQFDLPARDLATALRDVAEKTGTNLVAPSELVEGKQAQPLRGHFTADEAIAELLQGTGLEARHVGTAVLIKRSKLGEPSAQESVSARSDQGPILVTGSRIRGGPVAAPVIRLTETEIRDRGQATLAEAIRDVPQNFSGGQNPGVGNNVPASKGVNVGSSTSVNLRGLGSDATLTLINGHRISYSASRQAIDISTIPLPAVDRLEIVPDGASALYGSDAVAGVVNVVLKRDFEGAQAAARLGASTDGGDFEQRYDLLTGARWTSGGFFAAYEFGRNSAVTGKERSYTASRSPALTLLPLIRNHSFILSGHQTLGAGADLDVDGFSNDRFSESSYALDPSGNIAASGAHFSYVERSFSIAPTLRFRPGGDWNLFLTGSYARDHTHYDVKNFFQGRIFDFPGNCYCNHATSAEAGGDGTVFRLPGGPAKVAVGLGHRANKLVRFNGAGASTNISKSEDSLYGYGELSLPFVTPEQGVALVDRLSLSAAARYERYPGIGHVVTPKIAIIYAPAPDLDLKASWGKSFRAPTLYQQYQAVNLVLAPPVIFGRSNFPPAATALYLEGGNPDLKPERATNWSTTLDLHPRVMDGARFEISYFRTRYKDRVVTPIPFPSQALANPIYADRLNLNPSPALLAAVVASAASFGNATGSPYDPSRVAVLIDNRSVNAGFQQIKGVDVLFNYQRKLTGDLGEISTRLNATYLDSHQQLDPLQPVLPLAGIIFNPPHWSARGDLGWSRAGLTLNAGVSYQGGVIDTRKANPIHVRGMTTFDLTARIKSRARSGLGHGLEVTFTGQNLLNEKPARIATTLPSDAPYDSTNYSPVGRFLAVSVLKTW